MKHVLTFFTILDVPEKGGQGPSFPILSIVLGQKADGLPLEASAVVTKPLPW